MPYYLTNSLYGQGGGIASYTTVNGTIAEHAKLWHPMVRDRFNNLLTVLGNRYNKDFTFVGVALPETSVPAALAISTTQETAYYKNLLIFNQTLRNVFPNTITTQFINYTRERLQTFAPALRNMGAGIGGPDVWLDDQGVNGEGIPGVADGAYSYYRKYAGEIALTPSVMSGNYDRTCHDEDDVNNRFNPSIEELLLFAKNELKANIIFWTRDSRAPMLNYQKVLTYLNSIASVNPNDSRITLEKKCPTKYVFCLKQKVL